MGKIYPFIRTRNQRAYTTKEHTTLPKRSKIPKRLKDLSLEKPWDRVCLVKQNLTNINLSRIPSFKDVILIDCQISAKTFLGCVSLRGITIEGCTIEKEDLRDIRFAGAHLTRVRINNCLVNEDTFADLDRIIECKLGIPGKEKISHLRNHCPDLTLNAFMEQYSSN